MGWALSAGLAATAAALARRRWGLRPEDALLAGCLLAASEVTLLCLGFGMAGLLRAGPAACAALVLCAAQAAAAWDGSASGGRAAAWPRALWPLAGAAAAAWLFRLALSAAIPFESWDGLSYHLPIVLRWLQAGSLDLTGWSGPQRYFPPNGELPALWLAVLGGGRLEAAKNAQLLAVPLWAACGAAAARRLAGPRWTFAGALGLLCLPIAVIHAGIPYVDLAHAACWLAAAVCALAYDRTGRPLWMLFWAAGFGLSMGAKATLYFQAPLMIQPLLALRKPAARRHALWVLPASTAVILLTGGYSYAWNWLHRGSPIFPYSLKLAGVTVLRGIVEPGELLVTVERWFVARPVEWLWYPFRETMRGAVAYSSENGFGALFAAGWALWPVSAWTAARRRDWAALGFWALTPACVFFFMTMHPVREPRYVIFMASVPVLAAAAALRSLRGRALLVARCGWTLGAAWGLFGVLAYAGADPGLGRAWDALRRDGKVDAREYYRWQYGSLGEAWAALDAKLSAADVVAVNYGELILPLAGMPARARIEVVGTGPTDYPETHKAQTADGWLRLLDSLGARYYLLWSPVWYPRTGERERGFIAASPGRFTSLGKWDSSGFGPVELFELTTPSPR